MSTLVNGYEIKPGANLWYADLWGADLRDTNLRGANLWDANLRDADLRGANLRDANLEGADLWGADLEGANLWGAVLWRANLRDAGLRGATLPDNVYNINSLPADLPEPTQLKLATLLVHKGDWLEGIGGWLTHELVLVEQEKDIGDNT